MQVEIRLLQQTTVVKQDEVTQLKGNNATIATELQLLKQNFETLNQEENILVKANIGVLQSKLVSQDILIAEL